MYVFLSFSYILFSHLDFLVSFCTQEGKLPYRRSAQMPCRKEVGFSFVALGILEPQQNDTDFDQPQSRAI
jgi:hypothetical protein